MSAFTPMPDLVRLSRLDFSFSPKDSASRYTNHVYPVPGTRNAQEKEQWRRIKELGSGTFGAVYLEECKRGLDTGTLVAAKEGSLRAVKVIQKPKDVGYYRELEALSYFSYPKYERCFVKSFGWFEDSSSIYVAMEYLFLGDMEQYVRRPLPEEESQLIVHQLVEGLAFMHENGFVHRDLKPENILVKAKGPEWWVKIADFGISKRATEELTQLRTAVGTPAYMAPEVLGISPLIDSAPEDCYTNAVDMWSLGMISFLFLTAERCFKDQRQLGRYVHGVVDFPEHLLAPRASSSACSFVKDLIAIRPEARPSAAETLRHAWLQLSPERTPSGKLDDSDQRPETASLRHNTSLSASSWGASAAWTDIVDQSTTGIEGTRASWVEVDTPPASAIPAIPTRPPPERPIGPQLSAEHSIPQAETTSIPGPSAPTPLPRASSPSKSQGQTNALEGTLPNRRDQHALYAAPPQVPKGPAHGSMNYLAAVDSVMELSGSHASTKTPRDHLESLEPGRKLDVKPDCTTAPVAGLLEGLMSCMTFSPNGDFLALGFQDGRVLLHDVATETHIPLYLARGPVKDVIFSRDGSTVLALTSGPVFVGVQGWNIINGTGTLSASLDGGKFYPGYTHFALSSDGHFATMASSDVLFLYDIHQGARIWNKAQHLWSENHTETPVQTRCLTISPNNEMIALGARRGEIRLLHLDSGATKHTFYDPSSNLSDLEFFENGKKLLSVSAIGLAHIWNVASGHMLRTIPAFVATIATISPDTAMIASWMVEECSAQLQITEVRSDGNVLIRSKKVNKPTPERSENEVMRMRFSPGGQTLAVGHRHGTVLLWRHSETKAPSTSEEFQSFGTAVKTWLPGPKTSSQAPEDIKAHDVQSPGSIVSLDEGDSSKSEGTHSRVLSKQSLDRLESPKPPVRPTEVLEHSQPMPAIRFRSNAHSWARAPPEPCRREHALEPVCRLAFSPDGKFLAMALQSGVVRTIRVATSHDDQEEQRVFETSITDLKQGKITDLSFTKKGQRLRAIFLATNSPLSHVVDWDISTPGTPPFTKSLVPFGYFYASAVPEAAALSPVNGLVAFGSTRGMVCCYDLFSQARKRIWKIDANGHLNLVTCVAFSPDGQKLAAGSSDGGVRVLNSISGSLLWQSRGHESGIRSLEFSSDGLKLVTLASAACLWDIAEDERIGSLSGLKQSHVALSPDMTLMAACVEGEERGESNIELFDISEMTTGTRSGLSTKVLANGNQPELIQDMKFSFDGGMLAIAQSDGIVKIWEASGRSRSA